MCELFCISANRKIRVNELLKTFFSHSVEHRNGWGLALLDDELFSIEKEPKKALDSLYLNNIMKGSIETSKCIAHIRKATIGEVDIRNTHPFSGYDNSGRRWILAHNGTIFDSEALSPYQYMQEGTTDSERILLYIVDKVNRRCKSGHYGLSRDERIRIVDESIKTIVPGNKVNLMIYDGELFYIHKNEAGTLYEKDSNGSIIISSTPLEQRGWHEFPQNQMKVYCDGKLIYTGHRHDNTYVHDEEKMKLLYFAYSGL